MKSPFFLFRTGFWAFLPLLLAFISLEIRAQVPVFEYTNYSSEDGLPQTHIFEIWQDQTGFIWIATKGGLSRFDGSSFKNYYFDHLDSTSLNSSYVLDIVPLDGDQFLAVTLKGLNLYDPLTDRFTRFEFPPEDLPEFGSFLPSFLKDYQGNVWFNAVNGIYRFHLRTGRFEVFNSGRFEENYYGKSDMGISEDERRLFFINREKNNELSVYHIADNKWESLDFGKPSGDLVAGFHQPIGASYLIVLFRKVHSPHTELVKIDLSNGKKEVLYLDSLAQQSMAFTLGDKLYKAKNSPYLFARSLKGLIKMDEKGNEIELVKKAKGITSIPLGGYFLSKDEVLWLGASGTGIYATSIADRGLFWEVGFGRHSPNGERSIRAIFEDHQGKIWIGGYGGLIRFDPGSQQSETVFEATMKGETLISWNVYSLAPDPILPKKYLWFTLDCCVLNRLDLSSFKTESSSFESLVPYPHGTTTYQVVTDTLNKCLWVATSKGLSRVNPEKLTQQLFSNHFGNSLAKTTFLKVDYERKGIWVGSELGVSFFDPQTNSYTYQIGVNVLNQGHVLSIEVDKQSLWIGTLGGGLNKFNLVTEEVTYYTTEQGLPDNVVYSAYPDSLGRVWVTTNKGLAALNTRTGSVQVFSKTDGLQDDEFNTYAHLQSDKTGDLYFGGIKGVNVFDPNTISRNDYIPPVVMNEVFSVVRGASIPFDRNKPEVEVDPEESILKISFAALSYDTPDKNQFAYRLIGLNEDWVQLGNQNEVTLTGLSPGNYTLQVKASNNAGVWNQEGASMQINIKPPFYQEPWFLLLLAISLSLLIVAYVRYRVWSALQIQEELKMIVDERTQELEERNLKLKELQDSKDFFTGTIVHDLKIPLNTIADQAKDPAIQEASLKMMRLVANILDVQKLEDASMPVNLASTHFSDVVEEAIADVSLFAYKKSIEIRFPQSKHYQVIADAVLLARVLENLLSNAIKYSDSGTIVRVYCQPEGKLLKVCVQDSGNGIPPEKLHTLFVKYGQVNSRNLGKTRSTGLGLVFCKLAVEAMQGEIGLGSNEKTGATFWFTLQLEKEYTLDDTYQETSLGSTSKEGFHWTSSEKALLAPIAEELKECEVYEFSRVSGILEKLPEEMSPKLKLWKEEMIAALRNHNETAFLHLRDVLK